MAGGRRPLAAALAIVLAACAAIVILLLDSGPEGGIRTDLPARPVDGRRTDRPAQLVPLAKGVEVIPILSTGDTVGAYQMSGVPDGLGVFRPEEDRQGGSPSIEVLMNHELGGDAPAGVGARVSRVTLDADDLSVIRASYPIDGSEGFLAFCSSTLTRIGGRLLYLTGEESTRNGALTADPPTASAGAARRSRSMSNQGATRRPRISGCCSTRTSSRCGASGRPSCSPPRTARPATRSYMRT